MEKEKQRQGITLIALVITIIVLLILAGVTVATLTGDKGLLQKATNSKEKYLDGEVYEQIKLANSEWKIAQHTGTDKTHQEFMKENLEKVYGNDNVDIEKMGLNLKISIVGKKKIYLVKYDGTIKENDKIEKMAQTNVYGKLDENNDKILHLKATNLSGYEEIKTDYYNGGGVNSSFSGIEKIVIDEPIAPWRLAFKNCVDLIEIENIENFHTENITNMREMFSGCKNLETLDLSHFDTSSVTSMLQMFLDCQKLKLLDLSNFDTNKVTDMTDMFRRCYNIEELDLTNFSTDNVTTMSGMFMQCTKLAKINVSSFNTSRVTTMGCMFYGCDFTNIDLKSFDTSNVTSMSMMFVSCGKLTDLDLSIFDTNKVTSMHQLVGYCYSLENLNLSGKFKINDNTDYSYFFNSTVKSNIKIKASDDTKTKLLQNFSNKISESNFI